MIIRCPMCEGVKILINKFNHNHFGNCPLCKGKGKIQIKK